jgi:hypothetical protein
MIYAKGSKKHFRTNASGDATSTIQQGLTTKLSNLDSSAVDVSQIVSMNQEHTLLCFEAWEAHTL